MAQIIWTEQAILDLEAIANYIERNSPKYAQITIERIFNKACYWRTSRKWASRFQKRTSQIFDSYLKEIIVLFIVFPTLQPSIFN